MKKTLTANYDGLSPRQILQAALEPATRDFLGNKGKPLRELVAGAKLAFALAGERADKALVRNSRAEPPDIILSIDSVESFWEVTEVVEPGGRPSKEAHEVEDFTNKVVAESDLAKRVELIKASLEGNLQVRTMEDYRQDLMAILQQTKAQLLKKAQHYRDQVKTRGLVIDFGLLLHSQMGCDYFDPTDPIYWEKWVSEEEQRAADCFSDICLVDRDTLTLSALFFRQNGEWLKPVQRYRYTDPEGELAWCKVFGNIQI